MVPESWLQGEIRCSFLKLLILFTSWWLRGKIWKLLGVHEFNFGNRWGCWPLPKGRAWWNVRGGQKRLREGQSESWGQSCEPLCILYQSIAWLNRLFVSHGWFALDSCCHVRSNLPECVWTVCKDNPSSADIDGHKCLAFPVMNSLTNHPLDAHRFVVSSNAHSKNHAHANIHIRSMNMFKIRLGHHCLSFHSLSVIVNHV